MHRRVTVDRLQAPVSIDDRQAVLAIEAASFANPWTVPTFEAMLDTPVSHLYVARLDGNQIVGFCACWLIEDELHINTVAVHESFRRLGIASELLQNVLRSTGARRATLEVRASNEAAIRLYQKLGFRVTASRPRYYTNPEEDGLVLWLNP